MISSAELSLLFTKSEHFIRGTQVTLRQGCRGFIRGTQVTLMMILVKVHQSGISEVICFCDANLINKKFTQGNRQLDITGRFYKGEKLPAEKIFSLMLTARNLNIVGKESIAFALSHHIIAKDAIIKIQGIPHAQVLA